LVKFSLRSPSFGVLIFFAHAKYTAVQNVWGDKDFVLELSPLQRILRKWSLFTQKYNYN